MSTVIILFGPRPVPPFFFNLSYCLECLASHWLVLSFSFMYAGYGPLIHFLSQADGVFGVCCFLYSLLTLQL